MILDENTLARLIKVCALFASDKAGERASAAAMADRLVKKLGLSWRQILRTNVEPSAEELIEVALTGRDVLTAWESNFLHGIRGREFLSEKQRSTLHSIVAKVSAGREAA